MRAELLRMRFSMTLIFLNVCHIVKHADIRYSVAPVYVLSVAYEKYI